MLMQFIVENLFCFGAETTFSMVASGDGQHPHHLIRKTSGEKLDILRAAGVYGANGHGKTRLVNALKLLQTIVLMGVAKDRPVPVAPFRLKSALSTAPSKFEIRFHADGTDYEYGLVADRKRIVEEWLYARPKTKDVKLFERITKDDGTVEVACGATLKKSAGDAFLKFIALGTRPNQPFLTEAIERNVKMLEPAYRWFAEVLMILSPESEPNPLHSHDKAYLTFTGDFLRNAGTGVERLEVKKSSITPDHFPDALNLRQLLQEDFNDDTAFVLEGPDGRKMTLQREKDGDFVATQLFTTRHDDNGEEIRFSMDEESAGTQRLADLTPMLADLNISDKVYVVDELDRKLHPLLSYQIIDYVLNSPASKKNSQLIFTTHNTHLLDLSLLRRDEVWFVEKRPTGGSELYSLVNLRVRPDLNIEKGYLSGRFGAVPFLGNLRDLGWLHPSSEKSPDEGGGDADQA